jgi:hypothetical protein
MHGRLALAGLFAMLFLLSAAPVAAANDAFGAAKRLFLGAKDAASNAAADSEPLESLTPKGIPGRTHCVNGTQISQTDKTLWWWVEGTGRPLTVSTAGSDFDTHLGIFEVPFDGDAMCQDADAGGESITFDSVAGRPYWIQVGGCVFATHGCGTPTGVANLTASTPAPGNDARGAAAGLPTGQPVSGDNYGAGEEPGEQTQCGSRFYGRTVWYLWNAASAGTVEIVATAPNATLALFTLDGVAVGCSASPGAEARMFVPVNRGQYRVQVGGLGPHNGLASDSAQGRFDVRAGLTPGHDRDRDGILNSADCKPDDPSVHPGAPDRPNNGVDEDCQGGDASYQRIMSKADLDVRHVAGYAKVTALSVRSVPAGARVQVRCSGASCPFRRARTRTFPRGRRAASLLTAKLRAARITPRTTLEVRITGSRRIGSVQSFRFRRAGRDPAKLTRCLVPGSSRPTRCSR